MVFGAIGDALGLGGPDPKGPTQQERRLKKEADERFERSEEFFDPLQRRFERQADDSRAELLRGQANADTFQQLGGPNVGADGQVQDVTEAGTDALTQGIRNASNKDASRILQQRSNALDARAQQGQTAIEGLGSAADTATQRTLNDLAQEKQKFEQRQKAVGQAIGAGLQSLKPDDDDDDDDTTDILGGGTDAFGNMVPIGTGGDLLQVEPDTGLFSQGGSFDQGQHLRNVQSNRNLLNLGTDFGGSSRGRIV